MTSPNIFICAFNRGSVQKCRAPWSPAEDVAVAVGGGVCEERRPSLEVRLGGQYFRFLEK